MDREQALALLKQHFTSENHIKHSLVEAIMRAWQRRLGQDVEEYGLAGLCMTLIMIPPAKIPAPFPGRRGNFARRECRGRRICGQST